MPLLGEGEFEDEDSYVNILLNIKHQPNAGLSVVELEGGEGEIEVRKVKLKKGI